jgi:hypothetical protein
MQHKATATCDERQPARDHPCRGQRPDTATPGSPPAAAAPRAGSADTRQREPIEDDRFRWIVLLTPLVELAAPRESAQNRLKTLRRERRGRDGPHASSLDRALWGRRILSARLPLAIASAMLSGLRDKTKTSAVFTRCEPESSRDDELVARAMGATFELIRAARQLSADLVL